MKLQPKTAEGVKIHNLRKIRNGQPFSHLGIFTLVMGHGVYDYFIIYVSVAYSPWSDHVLGFWNLREDPNVLFLTYEDMIEV